MALSKSEVGRAPLPRRICTFISHTSLHLRVPLTVSGRPPCLPGAELSGSFVIQPDGSFSLEVVGHGDQVSIANNFVTFNSWSVSLSLEGAVGGAAPFPISISDLHVSVGGLVRVGGPKGFEASISGLLDSSSGTGSFAVSHEGGWVPASTGTWFSTPAFNGTLSFGPSQIQLSCAVQFLSHLAHPEPGVLVITEALGFEQPGPSLQVALEAHKISDAYDATYGVTVQGGAQIGPDSLGLPHVSVAGSLADTHSELTFFTPDTWVLLPGELDMVMPGLEGSANFDLGIGMGADCVQAGSCAQVADSIAKATLLVSVATKQPAPTYSFCGDKLELIGWEANATWLGHAELHSESSTALGASASQNFALTASGNLRIVADPSDPADPGFVGSVTAEIDSSAGSAILSIQHTGGYQPFPGHLFETPALDATLALNHDSKYWQLTCNATLLDPIDLGNVQVTALKGAPGTGPMFGLNLEQATRDSSVAFGGFFLGSVCVNLDASSRCLDVQAYSNSQGGFSLTGVYDDGDLTPGEVLSNLPAPLQNGVSVLGNGDAPLNVWLRTDSVGEAVYIMMDGQIKADLGAFGAGDLYLTFNMSGTISAAGPEGLFIASMAAGPDFAGDAALGRLSGLCCGLLFSLNTGPAQNTSVGGHLIEAPQVRGAPTHAKPRHHARTAAASTHLSSMRERVAPPTHPCF